MTMHDMRVNTQRFSGLVADAPATEPSGAYIWTARKLVHQHIVDLFDASDPHKTFGIDEVFVVWFSKVLQNWKALVSTTLPDLMYYEVTYNGEQDEYYVDSYRKVSNSVYIVQ